MGYFYDLMKTLKQKEHTIPNSTPESTSESINVNLVHKKATQPSIPNANNVAKTPKR